MAQNFFACDRDQELLLPPSLREWLPEGHLAWFVIDAVGRLDLSGVLRGLSARRAGPGGARAGDDGRAVALQLRGRGALVAADRAALRRGRRHAGDLRQPARPITRRSRAFASATRTRWRSCSARCCALCAEAGLVRVGVIAVDGTKVAGQRVASRHARLRADRARDPRATPTPSTPRRTSASATRAATSCPSELSTAAGPAAAGCATPSAGAR